MNKVDNPQSGYSYVTSELTKVLAPKDAQTHPVTSREMISNVDKQPFVYLIIGGKRSGKTTLCINLLDNFIMKKARFTRTFIVTPSSESDTKWGRYLKIAKEDGTFFDDIEDPKKFIMAVNVIRSTCQRDIIDFKRLVSIAVELLTQEGYHIDPKIIHPGNYMTQNTCDELNYIFHADSSLREKLSVLIYEKNKAEDDIIVKDQPRTDGKDLLPKTTYNEHGEGTQENPADNMDKYYKTYDEISKQDRGIEIVSPNSIQERQEEINKDMSEEEEEKEFDMDANDHIFQLPNHLAIFDDVMPYTGISLKNNPFAGLFTNSAHLRLSSIYMVQRVSGILAQMWSNHDALSVYPLIDRNEEMLLAENVPNSLFWRVYMDLKKDQADNLITHPFVHMNNNGISNNGGREINIYRMCDYVTNTDPTMLFTKPTDIIRKAETKIDLPIPAKRTRVIAGITEKDMKEYNKR